MGKNLDLYFIGSKPEKTFIGLSDTERIAFADDLRDLSINIRHKYKNSKYPYRAHCDLTGTLGERYHIIELYVDVHSKLRHSYIFVRFDEVSKSEYFEYVYGNSVN